MSFTTRFEQGFLFRLTRALALVIVVGLLLIGLVAGIAAYSEWPEKPDGSVAAKAVIEQLAEDARDAITPSTDAAPARAGLGTSPLSSVHVPEALLPHLAAEDANQPADAVWSDKAERTSNRALVAEWVAGLSPVDQQAYVDEMGAAALAAGRTGFDTAEAMNAFHELKMTQAQQVIAAKVKQEEVLKWAIGGAGALLLLIALFSLVLVLLAIERNTRRPPAVTGA